MTDPVPQRIGDAERDRAAEYLREHLAAGRLTQDEFDERLTTALIARTAAELEPLFADLPAPKPGDPGSLAQTAPWPEYRPPGSEVAPRPQPQPPAAANKRAATALMVASAIAWPAWIMFCFATTWGYWWLVFIPIMLSTLADQQKKKGEEPQPGSST